MEQEKPATGIMKTGDFGDAMFYYVSCECTDPDHAHTLEVEADDMNVQVHIYHTAYTKWSINRWKQIWQILTKGYAEMESTVVLNEQAAVNYGSILNQAVLDVNNLRDKRNEK